MSFVAGEPIPIPRVLLFKRKKIVATPKKNKRIVFSASPPKLKKRVKKIGIITPRFKLGFPIKNLLVEFKKI